MSLANAPSVTYGAPGNALASQALANNASVNFVVDFSANSLGGWVQVVDTGGGSVSTTNGCQVSVYPNGDNTSANYDTVAYTGLVIATVASTASRASIGPLPPGKYQFTLKNLDATAGITVQATSSGIA